MEYHWEYFNGPYFNSVILSLFTNGKKYRLNLPSDVPLAPTNIEWKLVLLDSSQ